MTKEAVRVLEDALQLSAGERAQIAEERLATLDDQDRGEVEAAWAAKIERRAEDARLNPSDDIDWREVLREAEQKANGR